MIEEERCERSTELRMEELTEPKYTVLLARAPATSGIALHAGSFVYG